MPFTARIDADPMLDTGTPDEQGFATPAPARAATAMHTLIGRDALLDQVLASLETARLLTLTGHSGSGKTSLAKAVFRVQTNLTGATPVAIHWVDLSALSDGELLAATIAQACEVALGGRAGLKDLVIALRASRALLILDNAEHLVDEVAAVVYQLLEGCAPDTRKRWSICMPRRAIPTCTENCVSTLVSTRFNPRSETPVPLSSGRSNTTARLP
jgi:ABC-type glutathione transport system ATPase component